MERDLPKSCSLIPVAILSYMSIQTLLKGKKKSSYLWRRVFNDRAQIKKQLLTRCFQLFIHTRMEHSALQHIYMPVSKSSHTKNAYLNPCRMGQDFGIFFLLWSSNYLLIFLRLSSTEKLVFVWIFNCPCSKLYNESQSFLPLDFESKGNTYYFLSRASYWKISFIVGKLFPLEKLLEHREVGTTKCVWVDVHFS